MKKFLTILFLEARRTPFEVLKKKRQKEMEGIDFYDPAETMEDEGEGEEKDLFLKYWEKIDLAMKSFQEGNDLSQIGKVVTHVFECEVPIVGVSIPVSLVLGLESSHKKEFFDKLEEKIVKEEKSCVCVRIGSAVSSNVLTILETISLSIQVTTFFFNPSVFIFLNPLIL